jgi:hypothetical protein
MAKPLRLVTKLLKLDENELRQLQRIKASLADAEVDQIYIAKLLKQQAENDYLGEYTPKELENLKDLAKIEVHAIRNKLDQFIDRAVNGGFEDDYEDYGHEATSEGDDFSDPSEFDEGFQHE